MKNLVLAAAALGLMACSPSTEPARDAAPAEDVVQATPEPAPPTPPPADVATPAPPVEDSCQMAQYSGLVGKPITEPGVPAEGAGVRHIGPNTQVTMDYRPDRLNIDIDANGVITGFRCGEIVPPDGLSRFRSRLRRGPFRV